MIENFVEKISDFDNLTSSQLISFFGYYISEIEKKDFFSAKDIEGCFSLLKISPYSNISSFLSNKSKGKDKLFIKSNQGYVLERKASEQITQIIGEERAKSPSNNLFPLELLNNTRGYIINIGSQASLCYDYQLYDASLVMIRKLIETLIIELYEIEGLASNIKNKDGHFFYLSDLIDRLQNEPIWNLSRNTLQSLPNIKKFGDLSAHNRRFSTKKNEMEGLKVDLRIIIEELIHLIDFPSRNKKNN